MTTTMVVVKEGLWYALSLGALCPQMPRLLASTAPMHGIAGLETLPVAAFPASTSQQCPRHSEAAMPKIPTTSPTRKNFWNSIPTLPILQAKFGERMELASMLAAGLKSQVQETKTSAIRLGVHHHANLAAFSSPTPRSLPVARAPSSGEPSGTRASQISCCRTLKHTTLLVHPLSWGRRGWSALSSVPTPRTRLLRICHQ
mmetsp:Transcript_17905/g.31402  ORF Transcript_17905/g.31402 Transcript_17905/m.31402 type:complete len:201 (-) Transcript_17905:1170-1772(-)